MTTSAPTSIRWRERDSHRTYLHPVTNEPLLGVTRAIDNLPKPFLKAWGEKLVAEEAVTKLGPLTNLAGADEEAAVEWLKKAPRRFTARSAKVGKEAHGVFEELALGNTVNFDGMDPDVAVLGHHFVHYLQTLRPTFALLEEGVYDDDYEYAGTFDAVAVYDCPDIIFEDPETGLERALVGAAFQDNKTTRSGVHAEVGLQLAAYRHAKYLIRDDGSLVKNRPGEMALVLHVRPEGWELIPVAAGQAQLEIFHHLLQVNDYVERGSKQIIGNRIAGNRARRATRAKSKESTTP